MKSRLTNSTNVKKIKEISKMKKDKKIVNIVENNKDTFKFECLLCKDTEPHMLVVMGKNGDIHVHAPFENKYLMNILISAVIEEQKKFDEK